MPDLSRTPGEAGSRVGLWKKMFSSCGSGSVTFCPSPVTERPHKRFLSYSKNVSSTLRVQSRAFVLAARDGNGSELQQK